MFTYIVFVYFLISNSQIKFYGVINKSEYKYEYKYEYECVINLDKNY